MTPLQSRIFWALRRGPSEGMSGDDLFDVAYSYQVPPLKWMHKGRSRTALKAHVSLLRKELKDLQIVGSRCEGGWYRLVKR